MSFEEVECDPCTVAQAARHGELENLEILISQGHPIDVYDNRGWRAIHEAANENYVDCIRCLLELETTDVNWQSFDGTTPLFLASQSGHMDSVQVLLRAKADPNIADHTDHFPLHEAVKSQNMALIELLLDNNAKVDCQNYCGTSPLHTAVAEGMLEITRCLIQRGASLDVKEEYNITPIFTAAHFGQSDCLQVLLTAARDSNRGDLINYPAEDGATPLFLASQEGHCRCVELLLEFGADANILTNTEPRALPVQAALEFRHLQVVDMLLHHTNLTFFKDCDCSPWYTVLTQCQGSVKTQLVELLIKHGADVNYLHTKDMQEVYTRFPKILRFVPTDAMLFVKSITPLTMSIIFEPGNVKSNVMKLLIEKGAHVNAQRLYEFPPLIPAVESGKMELLRMLIAAGANVNLYHPKIQGNYSVLLCMHQWQAFSLLLKVGADVQSMFNEEKYLYHVEKTMKHFKDVKIQARKCGKSTDRKLRNPASGDGLEGCNTEEKNSVDTVNIKISLPSPPNTTESSSGLTHSNESGKRTDCKRRNPASGDGLECCNNEEKDSADTVSTNTSLPNTSSGVKHSNEGDFDAFTSSHDDCSDDEEENLEAEQIRVLELNSYLSFKVFLVAARRVICARPHSVNLGAALHKMLYYCSNVNVDEQLWSFFDSQKEILEARQLTDSPRPLAHLCRLVIRKEIGSQGLLDEENTRRRFHLPRNIWDYIFFNEVDD